MYNDVMYSIVRDRGSGAQLCDDIMATLLLKPPRAREASSLLREYLRLQKIHCIIKDFYIVHENGNGNI